ncbi:MAG: CBS and ACT domain-containing protein, partial [Candidatus Methylomirabilales bacterium]
GSVYPTVEKVMSAIPVVVRPEETLHNVYRLMSEHRIRHVPVVSADGVVGVISDRDVREALPSPTDPAGATEFAAAMDRITAWEVMTEEVITVTPRTPLSEAAQILSQRKIGCLPVMEAGRLVGIVTETDMLRAFAALLGDLSGLPRLEVTVADAPGTLRDVSRLFADVPQEVGSFVVGWTEPASPGKATDRVLVLRFQTGNPEEILRILKGAGVRVLSVKGPETDRATTGGKR